MAELLSERALRDKAADLGSPVSGEQFRNYRKWGLLPEAVDGRWSVDVADTLVCIRRAEADARQLDRRVVLLWAGWRDCPPIREDVSKLREAMATLVDGVSIKAPVLKMRRVEAALRAWAEREVARFDHDALLGPSQDRLIERPFRRPSPEEWRSIIESPDLSVKHFAAVVATQLYVAGLLRMVSAGTVNGISTLPIEELLVLLTVREVAREREAMNSR